MSAQEWLDRADALAAAATEGPWSAETGKFGTGVSAGRTRFGPLAVATSWEKKNGEFIAACRSLLPQAVAALRAVLDLHIPIRTTNPVSGADVYWCEECSERLDAASRPCRTVQVISEALR